MVSSFLLDTKNPFPVLTRVSSSIQSTQACGGFLKWGYPQLSSILDWDFPQQKTVHIGVYSIVNHPFSIIHELNHPFSIIHELNHPAIGQLHFPMWKPGTKPSDPAQHRTAADRSWVSWAPQELRPILADWALVWFKCDARRAAKLRSFWCVAGRKGEGGRRGRGGMGFTWFHRDKSWDKDGKHTKMVINVDEQ